MSWFGFHPRTPPVEPNQSVARERARPASGGPPANERVARRGRAPLAAEALRLTESPLIRPRRSLHTTVEELAVLVGQHHQQGALERFSGAANNIRRIFGLSPSSALTRSLPSSRSRPCGRLDGLWVDWTSRTEGESQPYRQTVYHTLNRSSPEGGVVLSRSAASSAASTSRTSPAGRSNRSASRRAMVPTRGCFRFKGLVSGQARAREYEPVGLLSPQLHRRLVCRGPRLKAPLLHRVDLPGPNPDVEVIGADEPGRVESGNAPPATLVGFPTGCLRRRR